MRQVQQAIVAAVRSGQLAEDRLAAAVERVGRIRRPPAGGPAAAGLAGTMRVAAGRALVVEGELPDLAGARVTSIGTPANIAVGEVPWGIRPDVVVPAGATLPAGPLVVQVRDAHRHPQVGAMLAAAGGPVVVVEWGWPGPRTGWQERGHARICTRGSSQPMVAVVEEILRGAGLRK